MQTPVAELYAAVRARFGAFTLLIAGVGHWSRGVTVFRPAIEKRHNGFESSAEQKRVYDE